MVSVLFLFVSICVTRLTNAAKNITCPASIPCILDCSSNGDDGCYGYTIDGRLASSLAVECSSTNKFKGGCQFGKIYCPNNNGTCAISASDYYGTYLTEIISTTANDITLNCDYPQNSCSHTRIFGDNSHNIVINCVGDVESLQDTTCNNMIINGKNVLNEIILNCLSDYSCSDISLYGNNSNSISIYAESSYSFYNNIIYGSNIINTLDIKCGSQKSQYGCSNNILYAPQYNNDYTNPRTTIQCEGYGCYEFGNIYSVNGALDISLSINGCNECINEDDCINELSFYCGSDYSLSSIFSGEECSTNDCHCDYAITMAKESFINKELQCSIFEQDYQCETDKDCVIDCSLNDIFSSGDGCHDKLINAEQAKSLTVYCYADNSLDINNDDLSCSSSRISCPSTTNSICNVICNGNNACFETDIHETDNNNSSFVNITCIDKDSCSSLNIYGYHANNINIDCITSDACDNFNIYANYSNTVNITCQPKDMQDPESSAYSSCNHFNLYADNNKQLINLNCFGDFSCYHPFIYASNAKLINIDSIGQYSMYYGNVYAANANQFNLICRSEYGDNACYHTRLFIPPYDDRSDGDYPRTNITCEGQGCYYLYLYAIHGFTDLAISVDGCSECESMDDCVQNWYMHCGHRLETNEDYVFSSIYDGKECSGFGSCDCNLILEKQSSIFRNDPRSSCGFFTADFTCRTGDECIVDCNSIDCTNQIISGSSAKSLVVNCDIYSGSGDGSDTNSNLKGCSGAKIYCPTDEHSRCDVKCTDIKSCELVEIYGNQNNLIDLECLTSYTCLNTTIFAPEAAEINLNCFSMNSCVNMNIFAEFSSITNIMCTSNTTKFQYASCENITLYGDNIRKEINVDCDGSYSCSNLLVYGNNATKISTNSIGRYAMYLGEIHASNANIVDILCYSSNWYSSSCFHTSFYLPSAQLNSDGISAPTTITCQAYGCYYIDLYSLNGLLDYNFILNGCGECDNLWECYGDWTINCNYDSITDTYNDEIIMSGASWCYSSDGWDTDWEWDWDSSYDGNVCGCDNTKNKLQDSFDENTSGNCASYNTYNYTCQWDADNTCVIDCNENYNTADGCRNKIINATNVKGDIIVNCGQMDDYWSSFGLCENTKIYCPIHGDYKCTVFCLQDDSCVYLQIYSNVHDRNSIQLSCIEYGSCENARINAPYIKTIDVYCDSTDACYSLDVKATYVNNVNVVCTSSNDSDSGNYYWWWDYMEEDEQDGGSTRRLLQNDDYSDIDTSTDYWWNGGDWDYQSRYACDQIKIDANYSKNVNIFCNGNNSCYYSAFYADNAIHVNLTAYGQDAFYVSYMYAKDVEKLNVDCWSSYENHNDDGWWYNYQQGACDYAMFFLPSYGSDGPLADFLCQGYGCYSLYIFAKNGLQDMNVLIDGCQTCESVDDCIDTWYIFCGDEYYDYYEGYDYYDGTECKENNCECDIDILWQDSEECAYNNNNNNNDNKHGLKKGIIISIVIGVILILLCGIMLCTLRKKKQNIINNQVHDPVPMNNVEEDNDNNNINSSEHLARALAMGAMEGDETTKNKIATMAILNNNNNDDNKNNDDNDGAAFIPPASFPVIEDNNVDNTSLINKK